MRARFKWVGLWTHAARWYLGPLGRMAGDRPRDLFPLRAEAQRSAGL